MLLISFYSSVAHPFDGCHAQVYEKMTSDVESGQGTLISLRSAYKQCTGEPEVTTYVSHFNGTLDYLFVGTTVVPTVRSFLSVPSLEVLKEGGVGIPSSCHPSDHLPIGIEIDM